MDPVNAVRVRLFSVLKERTGQAELVLDAAGIQTVADALTALGDRYPIISEYRSWIRPAVNRAYASESTLLSAGDELALITPVSGG